MERIIKLIQEGNSQKSVAKDVSYFSSAVCKSWCKYKRNGVVKEGKIYL